jgi:hypothetical protein
MTLHRDGVVTAIWWFTLGLVVTAAALTLGGLAAWGPPRALAAQRTPAVDWTVMLPADVGGARQVWAVEVVDQGVCLLITDRGGLAVAARDVCR